MKLRDGSARLPHNDRLRYIARIELPLTAEGIKRIQKSIQLFVKDPARVLVAPTRCMGVMHTRGTESLLLSDVDVSASGLSSVKQEMIISKLEVMPGDLIQFTLLPGGPPAIRSYYQGMVKDWASDLIVEEVEWVSWIALATKATRRVSRDN